MSDFPEKQRYFLTRVNDDWVEIFEQKPVFESYEIAIDILKTIFPKTGQTQFRYSTSNNSKSKYCYPRLEDLLRPFRLISAKDVKIIMYFPSPPPNEFSSGLPCNLDTRRMTFDDVVVNYSLLNDLENPIHGLVSTLNSMASFGGNPRYFVHDFDIKNWMSEGVLPLNLSMTSEANPTTNDHYKIWDDFQRNLLIEIIHYKFHHSKYINTPKYKSKLIILCFGDNVSKRISKIINSIDSTTFEKIVPLYLTFPTADQSFIIKNVLSQVNQILGENSLQAIKWTY